MAFMSEPLLPPHGGYRNLKSFQVARLVYDLTVEFCDKHIGKRSRTHDQMVQAARSCVQNIAEGSVDSATSKKSELKLTGVARGSMEELRLDYEDFLRQSGLDAWGFGDPRRSELIGLRPATTGQVKEWVDYCVEESGLSGQGRQRFAIEVEANAILTLAVVTRSLLTKQLKAQAEAFESEGGFTERLHRIRTERRRSQA
jgi:four helix bundle suffix protein